LREISVKKRLGFAGARNGAPKPLHNQGRNQPMRHEAAILVVLIALTLAGR